MLTKRSGGNSCGCKTRWLVAALLFLPILTWGGYLEEDSDVVLQRIGELSGDLAEGISQRVTVIPLARRANARKTPIVFSGGLFLRQNGTAHGLKRWERRAIIQSYRAGNTIVLLGASVHDIGALHGLLGEGVPYDSTTDPVISA